MNTSSLLLLIMLCLTFSTLAVFNYHRDVSITRCYDNGKVIYINYSYFPISKAYRQEYNCETDILQHYKFHEIKRKVNN